MKVFDHPHFGANFLEILREKKLTQRAAAELLGWSHTNVGYYCSRAKPPRPHVLGHIAARLGVAPTDLLRGHIDRVREASADYRPTVPLEQTFMAELRRRWQRDTNRAALELAIRTLWPHTADQVKSWLDQK